MAPPAKTTSRRRGRRQGEPVSRDAVLRAAKERFAVEGYEKTTLRAIANDARVDPSMVLYLFGSKTELFRESLRLIIDPDVLAAAFADGDGDIGTRIVRTYLGIWEHPDTAASMSRDAAIGHVEPRRARSLPCLHAELCADRGVRRPRWRRAGPAAGDAGRDQPGRDGDPALSSCGCRRWPACQPMPWSD